MIDGRSFLHVTIVLESSPHTLTPSHPHTPTLTPYPHYSLSVLLSPSLLPHSSFPPSLPPHPSQEKSHVTAISSFQKDIMSSLPNYYFTFVDVMEFKDTTSEVITSLATSQFHLDIVSALIN